MATIPHGWSPHGWEYGRRTEYVVHGGTHLLAYALILMYSRNNVLQTQDVIEGIGESEAK